MKKVLIVFCFLGFGNVLLSSYQGRRDFEGAPQPPAQLVFPEDKMFVGPHGGRWVDINKLNGSELVAALCNSDARTRYFQLKLSACERALSDALQWSAYYQRIIEGKDVEIGNLKKTNGRLRSEIARLGRKLLQRQQQAGFQVQALAQQQARSRAYGGGLSIPQWDSRTGRFVT